MGKCIERVVIVYLMLSVAFAFALSFNSYCVCLFVGIIGSSLLDLL